MHNESNTTLLIERPLWLLLTNRGWQKIPLVPGIFILFDTVSKRDVPIPTCVDYKFTRRPSRLALTAFPKFEISCWAFHLKNAQGCSPRKKGINYIYK